MTVRRYSAYNTGGETVMTDGDRIAQDNTRNALQAQIAMAQLQAQKEIANIQSGDNRFNTQAMVATQGKYGDRASHENTIEAMRGQNQIANTKEMGAGNLAVQNAANAPAMGDLGMRQDKFSIEKPALQAKAGLDVQRMAAQKALMDRYLPTGGSAAGGSVGAPAVGGAPGAASAPGSGNALDPETAAAYAFGADPGDVLRMQGDERRWQRGQAADADKVKYDTAIKLLSSPKPEGQAVGAKMLSELKSFQGVDVNSLKGALAPERAPSEAFASRPSLQMEVDLLVHDAKDLVTSVNPAAGAAAIKQRMQDIASKAAAMGVRPEEALASIQKRLEAEVPTAGFWSGPITATVEGLSGGLIPAKSLSSRTQARTSLGLTRDGM